MLNNLIKDSIVEQLKLTGKASYIITDNPEETLQINWDGTKFDFIHILVKENRVKVILLNPREMAESAAFGNIILEMTKEGR